MDLTKKIFERLSNNKCTESNLYITLLDKVLNDPGNPPTAKDLYNAAVADYKRKEFLKAEERFNRSISICEDEKLNQKMYEILYDIAFNKKQYKKGFSIAGKLSDKCISNDKKVFEEYLLKLGFNITDNTIIVPSYRNDIKKQ